MFTELKLDLSSYDEMYLQIIDSLLLLSFGKGGYELISFYLYDRNNPDGSNNTLVDEDGNVIEAAVIERVKPVLEVLEDDGVADDDDDDDDEVVEDEDEDSDDDSDDENED